MSTYSNIKMGEIFVIYGNPFSRKKCSKNLYQVICVKHFKRVNFTSKKRNLIGFSNKIKDSFFLMGRNNSKVNLCNQSNTSNNTNLITNLNITNPPAKTVLVNRQKSLSSTTNNIFKDLINMRTNLGSKEKAILQNGEITGKNSFKTSIIFDLGHTTPKSAINPYKNNEDEHNSGNRRFKPNRCGTLQTTVDKNKSEDNSNNASCHIINNEFMFTGDTGSVIKMENKKNSLRAHNN